MDEQILELAKGQARIEQKVDDLHDTLSKAIPYLNTEIQKTNTRVDIIAMEQSKADVLKWKLGTLSAGAGATLSIVAEYLLTKLLHKA